MNKEIKTSKDNFKWEYFLALFVLMWVFMNEIVFRRGFDTNSFNIVLPLLSSLGLSIAILYVVNYLKLKEKTQTLEE